MIFVCLDVLDNEMLIWIHYILLACQFINRCFYVNLDANIGRIFEACEKHNYALLITADHGNAEKMITEEGAPFTAHTLYRGKVILRPIISLLSAV